jgi:hypothetical protein
LVPQKNPAEIADGWGTTEEFDLLAFAERSGALYWTTFSKGWSALNIAC